MQFLQKRPSSHVTELQALAEKQFSRANKLTDELARLRTKKQVSIKVVVGAISFIICIRILFFTINS